MGSLSLGHSRLRRRNRARVLLEIQKGEAVSRTQIAEVLGLSLMAVTRIVRELITAGLVDEGEKSPSNSPGRRQTALSLAAKGAYVVGLSINAYKPSVSLVNMRGEVVSRRPFELDNLADNTHAVAVRGDAIRVLIAEAGVDRKRVLGIGAVIGGVVDRRKGAVLTAPFLGWGFTDIAAPLQRQFELPVVVENIDNALLLAEVRFGIGRGKSNVLFVRSTAGLGGSLFLDGHLIRGSRFRAGHIGHLPVRGQARACSCGQIGCLNTVSSGGAVLADLGKATSLIPYPADYRKNRAQLDEVLYVAAKGDERTNRVLLRAGRCLGKALLGVAVAIDPEQILLAGPLGCSSSYQRGFKMGLSERLPGLADLVMISTMDDCHAAALLALSELVFSERLSLRQTHSGNWRERHGEQSRLAELSM
jgi:predicted NBD/HSP70 family sugar kinase/predicted transcriptional regulator